MEQVKYVCVAIFRNDTLKVTQVSIVDEAGIVQQESSVVEVARRIKFKVTEPFHKEFSPNELCVNEAFEVCRADTGECVELDHAA